MRTAGCWAALLKQCLLLAVLTALPDVFRAQENPSLSESATGPPFPSKQTEDDVISVDDLFGSNARFFTVCSTMACCGRTFRDPSHTDKVMLYIPTIHVDGDSYLSYYLGLVFDTFVSPDDVDDDRVEMHIVVLSLSHALPEGPFGDIYAARLVKACGSRDYSIYPKANCTSLQHVIDDVSAGTEEGLLYHKNLMVVVLSDALVTSTFNWIAMNYPSQHNTSLFAIIHLNHEQPWLDNQSASTADILEAYQATQLVFRTHYYSDFMSTVADNVHYLPLGPGLLQTERMALGLKPEYRRFPTSDAFGWVAASQRRWLCSFAGSMKYQNRGNIVESSRADMVHALSDMPGCVFYPTDDTSVSAPLTQREYMQLTHSTIFSLCPRGVGPETNRPYQALELGAIPLMVRESDPKMDFLVEWKDYPGPIFSSWDDVKFFLHNVVMGHISMDGIDALQFELQAWYVSFKARRRKYLRGLIHRAIKG